MQRILRLERNNIQKVRIANNGIQCHNILAFYHEPEKEEEEKKMIVESF